jgi:hypothetical protein
MSVLDPPRVYFRGQMTWDPIVTNNYAQFYDLATAKPSLAGSTVAEYRERARQSVTRGNWNVHGTHRSTFFETAVCGVDRGRGLDTGDPLVGVPMSFTGMLVDLDPYGATTSQLFFDRLGCGIDGGCQIVAPRGGPMVARRINFARNTTYRVIAGVASVVWQASFPRAAGLAVHPRGSPVLAAMLDRLLRDRDVLGLTVRVNAYRTVYFGTPSPTPQDAAALARQIADGGFHPNPARSMVVGVIGLWRRGEPPAVPGDRVLARAPGSQVGTAFARLGRNRLSLDLANSVPETGFDLTKLDLGPLTVAAGDVVVGTIPPEAYATPAYEATAGIVDLPLDAATARAARTGDLQVRTADGTVLLAEQPLTVVADPPDVYLEEGESAPVTLRAFERGRVPRRRVSVTMVEVGSPLPPRVVEAGRGGVATVPLTGGQGGSWTWMLVPWRDEQPPLPQRLVPELTEYLALRTTPADDDIAALAPTWDNVHRSVLRDFEALAPCMDNWLHLGDEQQCRAYAPLIRSLTSRERFDDYRYMPVTRELTRGQRTLLHRWCDAVTSAVPEGEAEAVATAAAEAPQPRDPFGRGF